MKHYELWQGDTLCAAPVAIADTFWSRFRGLMLRKALAPGEGLLLRHCSAIHCCFMRFPIDAVYLNRNWEVICRETVRPWRLGGCYSGTVHVLELEEGRGSRLQTGQKIILKECDPK